MTPDREYAERHGMTLKQFQFLILNAQRKLMRGEELSENERRAWRFAMDGEEDE